MLEGLRAQLKGRQFVPERVREKTIPKAGGKVRRLGIPTVADRVVQASLKLVLEPIFEADFKPCSYGFRPKRRAQDAIAEIHFLGSRTYEWVFEADITACFDEIDHTALMGRVRDRIGDKRVLSLVKAFLKAGVLSEDGVGRETITGTPQGGILSPLLANIALSVLDEHFTQKWEALGPEWTRAKLRRSGAPAMRIVRYADDFVVMIHGTPDDAEALWGEVGSDKFGVEPTCKALQVAPSTYYAAKRRSWSRRLGPCVTPRPSPGRAFGGLRGQAGAFGDWRRRRRPTWFRPRGASRCGPAPPQPPGGSPSETRCAGTPGPTRRGSLPGRGGGG